MTDAEKLQLQLAELLHPHPRCNNMLPHSWIFASPDHEETYACYFCGYRPPVGMLLCVYTKYRTLQQASNKKLVIQGTK